MMDHPRYKTAWQFAALTLGATLTLTACGGGGGGGDTPPTPMALETFQRADVVIGQPDFIGTEANQNGSIGANGFDKPTGNPTVSAEGQLFISDTWNSRILRRLCARTGRLYQRAKRPVHSPPRHRYRRQQNGSGGLQ